MMKCKDCKNLKNRSTYGQCYAHEGCKICRDSNDGCIMFEPAIQQTNGDRLRAMSNEELAESILICPMSLDYECPLEIDCKQCKLDWLNSPAESER